MTGTDWIFAILTIVAVCAAAYALVDWAAGVQ